MKVERIDGKNNKVKGIGGGGGGGRGSGFKDMRPARQVNAPLCPSSSLTPLCLSDTSPPTLPILIVLTNDSRVASFAMSY